MSKLRVSTQQSGTIFSEYSDRLTAPWLRYQAAMSPVRSVFEAIQKNYPQLETGRFNRLEGLNLPSKGKAPSQNTPKCADCAYNKNGTCTRPIGKHFSAGFNGYRSRLHVGCANERSRERDLTKRLCCGPSARFFEPKGSLSPMGGMQGIVIIDEAAAFARVHDTVGDSDGDDGA